MEGMRFIKTIHLDFVPSYGPGTTELLLGPLNVLIGPNASRKSNLSRDRAQGSSSTDTRGGRGPRLDGLSCVQCCRRGRYRRTPTNCPSRRRGPVRTQRQAVEGERQMQPYIY